MIFGAECYNRFFVSLSAISLTRQVAFTQISAHSVTALRPVFCTTWWLSCIDDSSHDSAANFSVNSQHFNADTQLLGLTLW